jgi:hypothetical protein
MYDVQQQVACMYDVFGRTLSLSLTETYCEISMTPEQRFRRSFRLLQKPAYTNIIQINLLIKITYAAIPEVRKIK